MKRLLLAALCSLTLLLVGCGPSPSSVVEDFVDAANEGDWTKAQTLSTGQANSLISMLSGFAQEPKPGDKVEIEIVSEAIDGDSATVVVKDQDGKEATIGLIKVDGDWKVATLPKG
ncbi:MAG: DUF4878 domain-containing protein [Opitutales bacterium]